jgi:phage terminase large subunit
MPAWSQVLFQEHWRHIAIHGGRGSSKSHSVARALLIRASQKTLRVLCAREIQDSIKKSVKQLLDDCIEAMGLRWFYTSTDSEIRGRNGSLFIFAGLLRNIDSVKSMEGVDICWVEEAQSVSQRSIDVLVPTIRKAGSQIIWVWNPTKQSDPVDKMFRAGKRMPDECVLEVNHKDNPWFTDELRAEMLRDKARDPDRYRHVWCGAYLTRTAASIFRDWHIVSEEFDEKRQPPKIPVGIQPRYGADWGFMSDPTTLVRCWVLENQRAIYIDYEAYGVGVDIMDTPALFATVPDADRHLIVADSSRPETISHMRKHFNTRIMPATKGKDSVEEGVKWLQNYTIFVHDRCEFTIKELEDYSRKIDPKTGEVLDIIEDKHNHCIDALRYALEGARRAARTVKPAYQADPLPVVNRW